MLQPTRMIVMQVTENHSLDIVDCPCPRGGNGRWETVDVFLPGPGQTLIDTSGPVCEDVLAAAGVKEDQAHVRVVDQGSYHDQLAAVMFLRWLVGPGDIGAG